MAETTAHRDALLRLALTPGLGPILTRRLIEHAGDPQQALSLTESRLKGVRGIGDEKARSILKGFRAAAALADEERALAARLGARHISIYDDEYPPLLRQLPDAPLLLSFRGDLEAVTSPHTVAMVGSRSCTAYGVESAERFAGVLGRAGLTVVSGGARGIDTAAHRGALRSGARTIVVMGCGLARCYPPENADLFRQIIDSGGAVVSELPMRTEPTRENFPARNRIISGLSLGVLIIEAGRGSGALITARQAAEEHGREVMAIPGRIDSKASEGTLELIKQGGAALVTSPADVIDLLETPARHQHAGVHAARYADPGADASGDGTRQPLDLGSLSPPQRTIVEALADPATVDDLIERTGLEAGVIHSETTLLEIRQVVVRRGGRLALRAKS